MMIQSFDIEQGALKGHLSIPGSGKGAGVLLLHPWWGLNPFMIQTCDRLAQAGFAIETARSRSQVVKAVVLFYGAGGGKFEKTQATFMGHFAELDQWESPAKTHYLAERIRSAGRDATFYTYDGTEHWFVENDRPEHKKEAADLAWERTIKFLRDELERREASKCH